MAQPESPHRVPSGSPSSAFGILEPFKRPLPPHISVSTAASYMGDSITLTTAPRSDLFNNQYSSTGPMATNATFVQWASAGEPQRPQHLANYQLSRYDVNTRQAFGYTAPLQYTHGPSYSNSDAYQLGYSAPIDNESACPRSYSAVDLLSSVANMSETYHPSMYQLELPRPQNPLHLPTHATSDASMQLDNCYERTLGSRMDVDHLGNNPYDMSHYSSDDPFGDAISAHDVQPPLDATSKKESRIEENNVDKDPPYAKLIYKALLEAPGHTMVLRDIYAWFIHNTDKANDKETKGWQNSIRHNLSMNGAFEKVDQSPNDEEKKGFKWRLTEKAIAEGVKSTTRYRSKLPNKRGGRSQHPAPQRQISGAKGGQAAKKSARLRRSDRLRETHHIPKSEPVMAHPFSDPAGFGIYPCADMGWADAAAPYFQATNINYLDPMKEEAAPPVYTPNMDLMAQYSRHATPESSAAAEMVYQFQAPDEPLFYNSPGSDNEPMSPSTPPPFNGGEHMRVDASQSAFFDSDVLM